MFVDVALLGTSAIIGLTVLFSRRSIGPLVLALCAGALLQNAVGAGLTAWLLRHSVYVPYVDMVSLIAIVLTLLPALLIWPFCVKTHHFGRRTVGAVVFAVLFATLICEFLPGIFAAEGIAASRSVPLLEQHQQAIISLGVIYALLEFILAHARLPKHNKDKRH